MFKIETILHPTDFSDLSRHAFEVACVLAREHRARVVLLHVATEPRVPQLDFASVVPPPEGYREELEKRLQWLEPPVPGVRLERWLEMGDPAGVILDVARETDSDVIVLGTRGRTGLGRMVLGSVAEKVVRGAPCPVVTVAPSCRKTAATKEDRPA